MKDRKWPDLQELSAEAREAGNIVIGALIGAYLGLAMTEQGTKDYVALGKLVVGLAIFAMAINAFGDRFARFNFASAAWYAVFSALMGYLSYQAAENLGVDANIVLTAVICWVILTVLECYSSIPVYLRIKNHD